jgi:hypothetical protein
MTPSKEKSRPRAGGLSREKREKEGKGPPPSLFETIRSFEGRES